MYYPKVIALFALSAILPALAAPAPEAVADAAPAPMPAVGPGEISAEAVESELVRRGFGCPFDRDECNTHCRTLKGGRTGGYCAGTFRTTCTCVFG